MSTIQTAVTRLLGTRTPIVLAPMAGASGGALASQVSLAGASDFSLQKKKLNGCAWNIPAFLVYNGLENFRKEFDVARVALNRPSGPLPIGAGFLGWKLDESHNEHAALLDLALENGVQAVWLSFGDDLGRWIDRVRAHDRTSGKTPPTRIFVQVNALDEALRAAQTWKVDVLVAQGIESGGHGSASAPPVLNLVPQLLGALPPSTPGNPPILAAGGLSSGAHLAAFLALGAAGAVVGTRFLVAAESLYSDAQKRAVLAARPGAAVRSYVFDELRGTTGWPAGVDGRALAMPAVATVEAGGDLAQVKAEVAAGAARGDPGSVLAWAGTGVGQLDRLQPAKERRQNN
ncbi:hypothetical protein BC834DRAFT_976720 [Gloeopeniophorella convolvens]|nr:hypothetical protein BC834DRAFT_976720 [Gloeopeniophorella convolvens]